MAQFHTQTLNSGVSGLNPEDSMYLTDCICLSLKGIYIYIVIYIYIERGTLKRRYVYIYMYPTLYIGTWGLIRESNSGIARAPHR